MPDITPEERIARRRAQREAEQLAALNRRESQVVHASAKRPLVRARKVDGAIFNGVCKGLEMSGRGSAEGWRVLFVLTFLFVFMFPSVIAYICMAAGIPEYQPLAGEDEQSRKSGFSGKEASPVFDAEGIEASLVKAKAMFENDLIGEEEYQALRKRILDL